MATYVENQPARTTDSGIGFLLGVILLIIAAVLFFMYALPLLGNAGGGASQVSLPSEVNVQTK